VDVTVGDKIKVHYKRDTIYDAKVIKVQREEGEKWPKFFVHYQGWNARYDEWIKRSRIAENLSWNKERAKRGFAVHSDSVSASEPTSEDQVTI
jgi:Ras-related protein Rab-1A